MLPLHGRLEKFKIVPISLARVNEFVSFPVGPLWLLLPGLLHPHFLIQSESNLQLSEHVIFTPYSKGNLCHIHVASTNYNDLHLRSYEI